MNAAWVYKSDETLQCGEGTEITLDDAQNELATIVGKEQILDGEKRQLPKIFPSVCGAPTGQVNAFMLTDTGIQTLFSGFVGQFGWSLWIWEKATAEGSLSSKTLETEGGDNTFPLKLFIGRVGTAAADPSNDSGEITPMLANLIASITQSGTQPTQISELNGRVCRCYKQGDPLTLDYRPQRVNIELNSSRIVQRIWFG